MTRKATSLSKRLRSGPVGTVSLLVVFAALFALFHFQGNATDVRMFGRSVFGWMVVRWADATFSRGSYSLGWLIPLFSLFIVWRRRRELADAPSATDWRGVWVVLLGLLMHWAGMRSQQPRASLMGFVVLLWGIPFLLYGWSAAKRLIFPCAYLVFCIPLNFLDSLTFPLRIWATVLSASVINGLGIAAQRSGTAIFSTAGGGFSLDVADPCSGIRYMLVLSALTAAYANLAQRSLWKQWLLFAIVVPLAVAGNVSRIVLTAIAARLFGQEFAVGLYHNYSGLIVFGVAVLMMTCASRLLSSIPTSKRQAPPI